MATNVSIVIALLMTAGLGCAVIRYQRRVK